MMGLQVIWDATPIVVDYVRSDIFMFYPYEGIRPDPVRIKRADAIDWLIGCAGEERLMLVSMDEEDNLYLEATDITGCQWFAYSPNWLKPEGGRHGVHGDKR